MQVVGALLFHLVFIVVVSLILALPVMVMWNYCLMPAVTGLNEIGWLQSWGILVLFGLLFKSSSTSNQKS